jgi:hypothetical protein
MSQMTVQTVVWPRSHSLTLPPLRLVLKVVVVGCHMAVVVSSIGVNSESGGDVVGCDIAMWYSEWWMLLLNVEC